MVRDLHLCSSPGFHKCWGWGYIREPATACDPYTPLTPPPPFAPPSPAESLSHTLVIQVLPGNCWCGGGERQWVEDSTEVEQRGKGGKKKKGTQYPFPNT